LDKYTQSVYRKNFEDLSEFEKEDVKREYNRIKSTDVDQLKHEADLHYRLMEQMSPRLKELDDLLKDLKESSYYKHGVLAISTSDFKDYENNMNQKIKLTNELQQLTNKDTALTNKINQDILSKDKFKALKEFGIQTILDQQEEAAMNGTTPETDPVIINLYAEYQEEVNNEVNSNEDHKAYIKQINLDQKLINELDLEISKFNKTYNYNKDTVTDSVTDQGKQAYAEPIYDSIIKILNLNDYRVNLSNRGDLATQEIAAELGIDISKNDKLMLYINDNIKIEQENIIKKLVEYYSTLKNNKIISENDNVLKSVL